MAFFKEELKNVKAFVFDVDGVLSKEYSPLDSKGEPTRTSNMKDGFAIRVALNAGYLIAVITGGYSERVKLRYTRLGVKYFYDKVWNKLECLHDFMNQTGIEKSEILYMGDDLLDYSVMVEAGIPTCPFDAVADIKNISKYVSDKKSGEGCVRDVIEQTMRAQNRWMTHESLMNNKF